MSDAKSHSDFVRDRKLSEILLRKKGCRRRIHTIQQGIREISGYYQRIYLGWTDFSELPIDLAIYVLVSCHGSAFQACVNSPMTPKLY